MMTLMISSLGLEQLRSAFQSVAWTQTLLDVSIKGLIVLLSALLLCAVFRRESAAARHLVWSVALAALLALPILSPALSMILPAWQLPLLPSVASQSSSRTVSVAELPAFVEGDSIRVSGEQHFAVASPEKNLTQPLPDSNLRIGYSLPSLPGMARMMPLDPEEFSRYSTGFQSAVPAEPQRAHWSTILLLIWIAGFLIVLTRMLVGTYKVWTITRSAQPLTDDAWQFLLEDISEQLSLKTKVELKKSEQVSVPMTWGVRRATVLLPADAASWSAEWRQIVLLHEMAHIKRRDCLTQLIANLACAVHWFNPLAWVAARQLRIERELACDDHVLHTGTRASDYAGYLVEIAQSVGNVRCTSTVAVGMACSQLESRVKAILDPAIRHRMLNRRSMIVTGVLIGCLILPLAALQPWASPTTQKDKKKAKKTESPLDTPQPKIKEKDKEKVKDKALIEEELLAAETPVAAEKILAESQADAEADAVADLAGELAVLADLNKQEQQEAKEKLQQELQEQKKKLAEGASDALRAETRAMVEKEIKEIQAVALAPRAAVAGGVAGGISDTPLAAAPLAWGLGSASGGVARTPRGRVVPVPAVALAPDDDDDQDKDDAKRDGNALTVDNLIKMKMYGVTPEFIESMRKAGFENLSIRELVSLKMYGVSEEFIREARNWSGGKITVREVISLKNAGVTADYIKQMKATGYDVPVNKLAQMKMYGVSPEYVDAMRKAGFDKLTADEITNLKMHGVSESFIKAMRDLGYGNLSASQITKLKMYGVSESYIKEMRDAGFEKLSADELIRLKMYGVSGEYIKKMRGVGLKNISANDAVKLKMHGVDQILLKN